MNESNHTSQLTAWNHSIFAQNLHILAYHAYTFYTFLITSMSENSPLSRFLQLDDGDQGSFLRLQNTEGLTLVGLFMEGTTLTCLETYSDAKKRTLMEKNFKTV
jgi:hypothetical protein